VQAGNGWTAITVTCLAPVVGGSFDVPVTSTP
jgi:hypothetical protein